MYSIDIANRFKNIFKGSEEAYGEFIQDKNKNLKKNKFEGKYDTKRGIVTESLIINHFLGKRSLGIIPINKEKKCNFSVIDIDEYTSKKEMENIIKILYKNNFPLLPFKSKSGGLHLYIFWENPIQAKRAKNIMLSFLPLLGLKHDTEIFPKQVDLANDSVGSFINLPYYKGEDLRFMYDKDLNKVSLVEALYIIEEKKISFSSLKNFFDNLTLSDAPPCLQTLYILNNTSFRNNYLFSLTCYYKAKFGDNFERHIIDDNNKLSEPLSIEELTKTIIASHKRKSYSFRCSDVPLSNYCNKKECRKREYGIGSSNISDISFEDFIKYTSDPPYYGWIINGKELLFFNELDIINQAKFREQCFRELSILPIKLTDIKWTEIINIALKNVTIKEVSPENDISPGMLFKEYLVDFFEKRAEGKNKEQILNDRVFKDKSKGYIFKPKNLLNFLIVQKQFKAFGKLEIQARLKKMGGLPLRYFINKEIGSTRVWMLPFKALEKYKDIKPVKEIEFTPEDIFMEEEY